MTATDTAAVTAPGTPTVSRERTLVLRASRGDHDAFAQLVHDRTGVTFRTMLAILGDEAEARDATQTAFIRAWRHLPALRDPATFPAWFHRIVVNTARTALRGRNRRVVRELSIDAVDERTALLATVRSDDHVAELDRLERAMDRISDGDRMLLWLHHYEDLSLATIADRLGIASKTVKSRLFSARRALERALAREDA